MHSENANWGGSFQTTSPGGGKCPQCGGTNLATGLTMNQNVEVGPFGLVYRALGIMRGTELLHADLCLTCGTVTRLYVKRTDRKWDQEKKMS